MAGAPRAELRPGFCGFISIPRAIARGVTDMAVGSGALLALFTLGWHKRLQYLLCEKLIDLTMARHRLRPPDLRIVADVMLRSVAQHNASPLFKSCDQVAPLHATSSSATCR